MKKPKASSLRTDVRETRRIRSAIARRKSVKITINIDAETLISFRKLAGESGVPYQRLINKTLAESLLADNSAESRLDRIERELEAIKRRLAA